MKKLLLLFFLVLNNYAYSAVRFVNLTATGVNNGTSWTNAFTNLQSALDIAVSGDQIWVAKGTYFPTKDTFGSSTPTDPRDKTFYLKNGVSIYGGFAGTESTLGQRVSGNTTILSGDIGTLGVNTDNCYHVMVGLNITNITTIDGLTLTLGNANVASSITISATLIYREQGGGIYLHASSPVLSKLTLSNNNASQQGGGIYCVASATPSISNVIFSANTSTYGGSGIYNNASNPTLTNVVFQANFANYYGSAMSNNASSPTLTNAIFASNTSTYGTALYNESSSAPSITNGVFVSNSSTFLSGAVYNSNSSPTLVNVTFANNTSTYYPGGVYNDATFVTPASAPILKNCVFWGNQLGGSTTAAGADVQSSITGNNTMTISYCSMQLGNNITNYPTAGFPAIGSSNNLFGTNPTFVNGANPIGADNTWMTSDDGLKIQSSSLCNNTGTTFGASSTDITGASRSGNTDIGAYEYTSTCPTILPPTVANVTNCPNFTNALTATCLAGSTATWYSASSGGTALASGSYTTPSLATSATYYVACESGGTPNCVSTRSPQGVTIITLPSTLNSATTGNWNVSGTWTPTRIPLPCEGVQINATHTVTVPNTGNQVKTIRINSGGVLRLNSGGSVQVNN